MTWRATVAAILVLMGILGGSRGASGAPRRIVFLHTSDVHGMVRPLEGERDGGYPQLARAWRDEKARALASGARVFTSDGGDMFQGTPVVNESLGACMIAAQNALRLHMVTFGNHAFDYGLDVLRARMDESRALWVGSNLDFPFPHRRRRRYWLWRPGVGTSRPGPRVAFIGATIETTPDKTLRSRIAGMAFHEARLRLPALVKTLRASGKAEIVVLLSHLGLERDLALAAEGLAVDLILGGHDHLRDEGIRKVGRSWILHPGAYGKSYARVELVWDDETRRIRSVTGGCVDLDGGLHPADPAMEALLAPYVERVAEKMARVLCELEEDLDKGVRGGRAPVAALVARAMRRRAGTDLAFMNFGGVRMGLDRGTVTVGAAHRSLPFGNWLVTGRMTGRAVRDLLESAVGGTWGEADEETRRFYRARFATELQGWLPRDPERGFLHPAGLRFTFDPRRPAGRRVASIVLDDGTPLDETRRYSVAINNFLHEGGDGFPSFRSIEAPAIRDADVDVDMLCDELEGIGRGSWGLPEEVARNLALRAKRVSGSTAEDRGR